MMAMYHTFFLTTNFSCFYYTFMCSTITFSVSHGLENYELVSLDYE